MDDRRFDTLARALGAATSRRGALAALAGLGLAGAAAPAAEAEKGQRRKCRKDSPPGQCCRKDGTCTCRNGGTVCGANCCLVGQVCDAGTCVQEPEPDTCIVFGQPCKNAGAPCCDDLVCGSGQGGSTPACYVPAGGSCLVTADCTYGSTCQDDVCIADQPAPTCVPTFEPTGDPVADGKTLQALVAAANGTSGTVITLGSGTYALSGIYSLNARAQAYEALPWSSGSIVIGSCPGGTAKLQLATINTFLVNVKGGSLTLSNVFLEAPGAIGTSGIGSTAVAVSSPGAAILETITVSGFAVAVTNNTGGNVTLVGGSFTAATAALNGLGVAWTCSGSPQLSAPTKCADKVPQTAACGCV